MAKRTATSDLNHDNWDKEDKPEEAGTFRKADGNAMQSRVIRQAKRRSTSSPYSSTDSPNKAGDAKNVFANFSGFKMNPPPVSFNFGGGPTKVSGISTTVKESSNNTLQQNNGALKGNLNFIPSQKDEENKMDVSKYANMPNEFFGDLKALNESVSKWIQTHVEENSNCILTPVFRDYEKHLNNLEKKYNTVKSSDTAKSKVTENQIGTSDKNKNTAAKPFTFSFGVAGTSDNFSPGGLKPFSPPQKKPEDKNVKTNSSKIVGNTILSPFSQSLASTIQSSTATTGEESNKPTMQFSFGSQKPFMFANVSKPETVSGENDNGDKDGNEEPPKAEFTPVVEKDAIYSQRCKVFVKKGGNYQDRGVGTLFLKPVSSGAKTQLIVRADTSLGNVLLNTLLFKSMPLQRMGNNNVMLVCIPTPEMDPPPVPVLLRVKTAEDADKLLEKLQDHIK